MSTLTLKQMAELRTIYPQYGNLNYQDLLKGISRKTLIRFATMLIGKNIFYQEPPDNKVVIDEWFSEENRVFGDDMLARVKAYEEKSGKELSIVYNISCLKVLQAGLEFGEAGDQPLKSEAQSEIDLMLALLVLNQNEDYNQTKDSDKIRAMFSGELNLSALVLNYGFPTQDITNFDLKIYTINQIIKFLLLFQFLETSDIGKQLIERFCKYYGFSKWQEYILAVFPILLPWVEQEKAGAVDIVLARDDNYDKNLQFLNRFAQSDYAKIEDKDYIKLREKPLIQLDETTFRTIHPIFVADKIFKGQFFLLKQLNEDEPKLIGNFRQWFTSNFSEGYCFAELIRYAFSDPDVMFFDEELKVMGVNGPSDGYVRYNNDLYLFENKDILIGAAIKESYDIEVLFNEIKKKLLIEGTRPVGIGQLVTNIRRLLDGTNTYDKGFSAADTNIYPIIVLHDPMFDTPGLNKILNDLLKKELIDLKKDGLNTDRIKPLTLINIDTLILLAPSLAAGRVSFKELLDDFAYVMTVKPDPAKHTAQQAEQMFSDATLPFNVVAYNYMQGKFGGAWHSEALMAKLLEKAGI